MSTSLMSAIAVPFRCEPGHRGRQAVGEAKAREAASMWSWLPR
jgi:hypothetical protein